MIATTGRVKQKTRRFRSSLANAHVAWCGWLGIQKVHDYAFGLNGIKT
jgi:hypothetical protein